MWYWFDKARSNLRSGLERYKMVLVVYAVSRLLVAFTILFTRAFGFGDARIIQWDANSYLSIATQGYHFAGKYSESGSYIGFFPAYSLLVRAFHSILGYDVATIAVATSFVAGIVAVCTLYELVLRRTNEAAGLGAVAMLCFFPASVFLSSAYTEGLFLALTLGVLLALDSQRPWTAVVLTAFALITRINGVILLPILAISLWQQWRSTFKTIGALAVAAIPLAWFTCFQWIQYGTPLAYVKAQTINWNHHLIWPWQGLYSLMTEALHGGSLAGMWRLDATIMLVVGGTLIAATWQKAPWRILAFGWGTYLLVFSQSFVLGTTRYMMLVIPFYWFWGKMMAKSQTLQYSLIGISATWMTFGTILFSLSKYFF